VKIIKGGNNNLAFNDGLATHITQKEKNINFSGMKKEMDLYSIIC
jgi:hypothetical protein